MRIEATTVNEYMEAIPDERKKAMQQLRSAIKKNLPKGYTEILAYNMPTYGVPHNIYPAGYHVDSKLPLMLMSIASQKNFIALYHMGLYADNALLKWFTTEYAKQVKTKLDMGKSCIRFKNADAIPFDLIAELATKLSVEQWIKIYEGNLTRNTK
ncbi:MAG: DUF1801 domain-containing protein [Bacteroidetes bacterium]|nr:DUF1801 domain-containing protein [Bacteroidota bacterium]MBP7397970.1 DUF1801 domain-containing protein [Chitinophagales bacterium]MBK7108927.1 DUF1801 domain-containing protein [Bacteroidota bacterium]MBK8488746.1 DUF1801 domain-containing protein [Bacteroidota bacterium]MBK8681497.1 DUF1801 domain-containing protein [Bacteroidota bacterium]